MDHAALVHRLLRDLFELDVAEVDGDATLDGVGLDSLDRAELALALEEEFGGRIDDEDLLPVRTLDDLAALAGRTSAPASGTGRSP